MNRCVQPFDWYCIYIFIFATARLKKCWSTNSLSTKQSTSWIIGVSPNIEIDVAHIERHWQKRRCRTMALHQSIWAVFNKCITNRWDSRCLKFCVKTSNKNLVFVTYCFITYQLCDYCLTHNDFLSLWHQRLVEQETGLATSPRAHEHWPALV